MIGLNSFTFPFLSAVACSPTLRQRNGAGVKGSSGSSGGTRSKAEARPRVAAREHTQRVVGRSMHRMRFPLMTDASGKAHQTR